LPESLIISVTLTAKIVLKKIRGNIFQRKRDDEEFSFRASTLELISPRSPLSTPALRGYSLFGHEAVLG